MANLEEIKNFWTKHHQIEELMQFYVYLESNKKSHKEIASVKDRLVKEINDLLEMANNLIN